MLSVKRFQVLLSNTKFYLHTVKWFQVLLRDTNLISVMCLLTMKWLNSSILSIDEILTDNTTTDQNGQGSNSNKNDSTLPKAPELERHHQMV